VAQPYSYVQSVGYTVYTKLLPARDNSVSPLFHSAKRQYPHCKVPSTYSQEWFKKNCHHHTLTNINVYKPKTLLARVLKSTVLYRKRSTLNKLSTK